MLPRLPEQEIANIIDDNVDPSWICVLVVVDIVQPRDLAETMLQSPNKKVSIIIITYNNHHNNYID